VNDALGAEPALVNTAPYENGWLFKVRLANSSQLDALKSPDEYRAQIG
jgi:glycine cleavage system H protein